MNSDIVVPSVQFKDRKVGLVIFGALTLLGGCICALFVPFIIAAPMIAAKSANPPPVTQSMLPAASMYGAMAIAFIWLGIGSIMTRRWARALLAIWSCSSFAIGLVSLVAMAVLIPHIKESMAAAQPPGRPPLSEAAQSAIMIGMFAFMGCIVVIGPLIWALFYSGKNVKATCEARDPVERWTDRCPMPVLALSLWVAFGALAMLLMPLINGAPAPFFGTLLFGGAAIAFFVFAALIWGYCAWALYRLDRRGWWVLFFAMVLFSVSGLLTYTRHNISEVFAMMHYSKEQLAVMNKMNVLKSSWIVWSSLIFNLPILGYLLYIRKYFTGSPTVVRP